MYKCKNASENSQRTFLFYNPEKHFQLIKNITIDSY